MKDQHQVNTLDMRHEISELEKFFASADYGDVPIRVNEWTNCTRPKLFVTTHLQYVKANYNKIAFLPYLERLQELKGKIETTGK